MSYISSASLVYGFFIKTQNAELIEDIIRDLNNKLVEDIICDLNNRVNELTAIIDLAPILDISFHGNDNNIQTFVVIKDSIKSTDVSSPAIKIQEINVPLAWKQTLNRARQVFSGADLSTSDIEWYLCANYF